MRWPLKTTWPLVAGNNPMISLSSTVFPQPLSPMIASVCPRGTESVMSRNTTWRPNWTPSLCSSMSDAAESLGLIGFDANAGILTHCKIGPDDVVHLIESDAEEKIESDDDHK